MKRPLAVVLAASLAGCAGAPRVAVAPPGDADAPAAGPAATGLGLQPPPAPSRQAAVKVAVLPFEDKSGSGAGAGGTAAALFTQELLKIARYRVVGDTPAGAQAPADPIEWGRRQGVDAVLVGSVAEYRERRLFILPPAKVVLEARLIDVASRQVLWSASDSRGYEPWRWLAFIPWPIGVALAFFAPSAEGRLRESVRKTADAVRAAQ